MDDSSYTATTSPYRQAVHYQSSQHRGKLQNQRTHHERVKMVKCKRKKLNPSNIFHTYQRLARPFRQISRSSKSSLAVPILQKKAKQINVFRLCCSKLHAKVKKKTHKNEPSECRPTPFLCWNEENKGIGNMSTCARIMTLLPAFSRRRLQRERSF